MGEMNGHSMSGGSLKNQNLFGKDNLMISSAQKLKIIIFYLETDHPRRTLDTIIEI